MKLRRRVTLLGFLLLGAVSGTARGEPFVVPEALQPWVPWVLHGHEEEACPFAFDDGTRRRCAWPGELHLAVDAAQGSFRQRWEVYAETWLTLPGDPEVWPQEVTVDGTPAIVVEHAGRPAVRVPRAGAHTVAGRFRWARLPESLSVPPEAAWVRLAVAGTPVPFPDLAEAGRLWLRERGSQGNGEVDGDRVTLQVFRRIVDEVPLEVVTRLDLQVSGSQREVALGPAMLPEFLPVALESPIPARLEADGSVRLQVRPGRWSVQLRARHPAEVSRVPVPTLPPPWPAEEIWVFDARNHLRLVEPRGLATVDPRQTNLPPEWQQLPAFRALAGGALDLHVVRRGDPEPEPDRVVFNRTLWLDFDGQGYTVQDRLSGSLSRSWRLEAREGLALGRVVVDGTPQLITRRPDTSTPGVEVRRGALDLVADSRWEGPAASFPAVGWRQGAQNLQATLHLPPGWEVFSIRGPDNKPPTWLARWTLLDLFVVLLAVVGAFRLWGWRGGILTLATLGLVWHAPGAPRWVWLNLFAAAALLRVVPEGRPRTWVRGYLRLSLVALMFILIPFAVQQIKTGLFPSLERPYQTVGTGGEPAQAHPAERLDALIVEERPTPQALYESLARKESGVLASRMPAPRPNRADPKALVQTGPGLPEWQWTALNLNWNGPVASDETLTIRYISPPARLAIHLLRVLLSGLLALIFGAAAWNGRWRVPGFSRVTVAGLLLGGLTGLACPPPAPAEYPPPELLQTLEQRLLEPAACLPRCAEAPRLLLQVTPQALAGRLEVQAAEHVAVPVPGHPRHWIPAEVTVDGEPARGLYRTPQDELWLELEPGVHQVGFRGPLPDRSTVQIPFVLRPRHVAVESRGWGVNGVHEDGSADPQIQLTRIRDASAGPAPEKLEPGALPPFVRVERQLSLDLDWRVTTRVVRLSPPGVAAVIAVPLLPGEAVTTPGIRAENDKVLVNLSPQGTSLSWQSTLEVSPVVELSAPRSAEWAEAWTLDPGPVWHIESIAGIAVVHHQDPQGRWLPQWRPFPGESVRIAITRPESVAGQTLTIDRSQITVTPGKRATDTELRLNLRSSLGGQHDLQLPQGAELQTVTIGGAAQPIRQEAQRVTLPVVPGVQEVVLTYRTPVTIRTLFATDPPDLGSDSVNHTTRIAVGRDRWVLLTLGPRLGPAVLFWGALVVIVLAALGLGKVPLTPLRWWHWALLGLGFTQSSLWTSALVVGWLLALGARRRIPRTLSAWRFNLLQVGLVALTAAALVGLFGAVQRGLLGLPEMMVLGNGSSAYDLRWFADRVSAVPPRCTLFSLPLLGYRLAMLAWALWLAFSLLRWLRWGWDGFADGGLWRASGAPLLRFRRKAKPDKAEAAQTDDLPGWDEDPGQHPPGNP